jgi:photosystem II stability/assembly factor-like uncharacterized protein
MGVMQRRAGQRKSATRRRPTSRTGDRASRARRLATQPRIALLVATRKGAFFYHANAARTRWRVDGPHFFGQIVNHVMLDPRDPAHLYVGASGGGSFESTDRGESWRPLNEAVEANFNPDPYPEYGQDPHCMALHPLRPDRLYQQNHCGIYRLDRPATRWQRVGRNMPAEIGDIGFGIVLHPRDPDTAWVFPMDGTSVWPRTSIDGKPALYCTRDAGASWQRQDRGLPREQAWYTVKRQAFCADVAEPVGVYFGTTSGELWMSPNEGRSFRQIAAHLPHVYSVVAAILP